MAQAEYQITLPARTETDDDPAIAAALAKVKAQTGRIPNMYARMANVPGLLETYLAGYAALRQHSGSARASSRSCSLPSAGPTAAPTASPFTAGLRTWRRFPPR